VRRRKPASFKVTFPDAKLIRRYWKTETDADVAKARRAAADARIGVRVRTGGEKGAREQRKARKKQFACAAKIIRKAPRTITSKELLDRIYLLTAPLGYVEGVGLSRTAVYRQFPKVMSQIRSR
jgi:hypothetical protein